MTGEYTYTGWFDGWQNARQRRAIEDLETGISSLSSSLSRQRRESAQLRTQLSRLQGTLEQRVERLTRSLEALVELSDVRLILAMYDPPALVRHWAQEAITAVVDAGKPADVPPPPIEDVPDYWLAPAVLALVALARGEDASEGGDAAAEALSTAEQRDPGRTALLLSCGLTLAGRPERAQRWLADALGVLAPGVTVTVAQRALWSAMAAGRFGPTGATVLRQGLGTLVEGLTPEQQQAEVTAWAGLVDGLPASGARAPEMVRDDVSVKRCLDAGAKLAALRALCSPEKQATSAGEQSSQEDLTEVVHSLVDEGTVAEAPLLRRAVELRAAIADGAEVAPQPGWDSEAGDPCDLLRLDAFDPGQPARAALARQAGRRWLLDAAGQLAEAAASSQRAEATLKVAGGEIRVSPAGPDSGDLSQARTRIEARPVVDPRADKTNLAVAIAGGVLSLAVFGWPNGLAVLAVLSGAGLLVTGGVRWLRERQARALREQRKQADLARLERSAEQAVSQLAELQRQLAETGQAATADLSAIRTELSSR
jgi:hypothetical protein